ncbi:hypothetical protein [Novipirellula herctigrandis]
MTPPTTPDRYCDAEATSGRMVELIQRRQTAVMLCHWPLRDRQTAGRD